VCCHRTGERVASGAQTESEIVSSGCISSLVAEANELVAILTTVVKKPGPEKIENEAKN
jgi:hypothetical protein